LCDVAQVCTDVGACDAEQFEFVHEPLDYLQEHWDDKCYVCQAFAKDLEVPDKQDVCRSSFHASRVQHDCS
jgi:hypothetical protein